MLFYGVFGDNKCTTTLVFMSGTSFSNRMPYEYRTWIKKMESDMSKKANNKGEIIYLIKWNEEEKIGIEWYFDEHICLLYYYCAMGKKRNYYGVSFRITRLQLSFPSHTHWTELNCISISSHEQRYERGAHRLRLKNSWFWMFEWFSWCPVRHLSFGYCTDRKKKHQQQQWIKKKSHSKHGFGEEISFSLLRPHTSMDDICCDASASVCVVLFFQLNNIV